MLVSTSFFIANLDPGGSDASQIMQGAQNGSQLIVSLFEKDWEDLVNGNSPVYTAVTSVALLAAVALVSFWSLGWYVQISEEGFSSGVITEMVYPLLVIMMLAVNNGALLANSSLALRNVSNNINDNVLNITRNGVTLKEAIRNTSMDQAFIMAAKAQMAECEKQPLEGIDQDGNEINPRQICINETTEKIKKESDDFRAKNNLPETTTNWNIFDLGGQAINATVQGLSYIIFSGLAAAFQYVVQVSFLLSSYIGPIFLVLSLLPLGAKPILAWLAGWLALGLVLVSYSIIVGIAASSIVNTPSNNPLFLPLVEAILSPILAVAIGSGGGMAVFTGFSNTAKIIGRR
ncbi:MAG: hypothetical protein EA343_10980 [Nodularia sp. (in: Bacteria)]|nr:MAG: hypothetical protein EA343_10980 [Nodularia sp. (in: cyanobacteria)]